MTNTRSDIIKLIGVSKIFPPDDAALKDIEFSIAQGEFIFLAGRSGSGKSTLLKLLYGSETATDGSVIVGGRDLSNVATPVIARLRRSVGLVFRDTKFIPGASVVENVALALEVVGVATEDRLDAAGEILKAFGLEDKLYLNPASLSSEEKQRVGLARALVGKPKIILADDPSGSLDKGSRKAIFDILAEAHSCGVTVVVATSDVEIVEEVNQRTIVLESGKMIGDFAQPA